MYLRHIELRGFKSFADAKDIVLGPGVTGIVGPNGSGKSNICDALRWVLGEQNSRMLRGSSLQDVIFKGTQARPKRHACEVSLVFDNTDSYLNLPYTEVAVTRRTTRSGDSTFQINGTDCRLRDITDLFRNTGVGRDGYSVIGQGQISKVLDTRAAERRIVFEEAAGVAGYRAAMEEAERNLSKTRENINRVSDILNEIERQVGPAREQMELARRFLDLSNELKKLDVTLLLSECDAAQMGLSQCEETSKEAEKEKREIGDRRDRLQRIQTKLEASLATQRGELQRVRDALNENRQSLERKRGERALAQQKNESASAEISRLTSEIHAAKSEAAGLQRELESNQHDTDTAKHKCIELGNVIESLMEVCADDGTAARGNEGPPIGQLAAAVENADRAVHELENSAGVFEQRKSAASALFEDARTRRDSLITSLEMKQQNLEKMSIQVADAEQHAANVSHDAAKSEANLDSYRSMLQETERQLAGVSARAEMLAQIQSSYDGYHDGVRSLMHDAANNEEVKKHITGVIGESIQVQEGLETAIETALGAGINDVVVPSDSDAKWLVSYLRRLNYGRVTFLPADALRTRTLSSSERNVLRSHGVLSPADEAVECDDSIRPAVRYLLGRTVIVHDLDTALRLKASGLNTFRIVTVGGEIVSQGGAITGGAAFNARRGFFARSRNAAAANAEVRDLKAKANELRERCEAAEAIVVKSHTSLSAAKSELNGLIAQLSLGKAEAAAIREDIRAADEDIERCSKALAELKVEECDVSERLKAAETRRAKARQTLLNAQELEAAKSEASANAAIERADVRVRIANETAKLNEAKGILRVCRERELNLKRSASEKESAMERAETALHAANEEFQRTLDQIQISDNALSGLKAEGERFTLESEKITAAVEALEQRLRSGASDIERTQEQERRCTERVYKAKADHERMAQSYSHAAERLWSDYELTIANARSFEISNVSREKLKLRLQEVRRETRTLGPVNPQAAAVYQQLQERETELRNQIEDLTKAETDLKQVISDLLDKMRLLFLDRFSRINESFKRTFTALFGGGDAHLELSGNGDVMNAGVEIMAEPPGKKLQNLSLLSGGERTLTAIALCLAMLSVNPSPVCVLDEIDAPLDDRNAVRLAEYMRSMSGSLQFIVITHRKTTMAACDALYGVSMPEQGVSDIVSVQLR